MSTRKYFSKKSHTPYYANLRETEDDLILRYGASISDDLWFLGRAAAAVEIEHRKPKNGLCRGTSGEQHGASVRKHLGPIVKRLSFRLGQHLRFTTARRNPKQPGALEGKDDRVVRSPA